MAKFTGHTITPDSALGGLEIERSLKFNGSELAHLDRTPSARGNRKVWTYSCWYKQTQYHSDKVMFLSSGASGNTSSMHLTLRNVSSSYGVGFTGVGQGHLMTIGSKNTYEKHYREFGGGWYNFVWHCDTTGSSGDYLKTYSNGTLVTSGNLDWGAAANTFINNHSYKHTIGDMSYSAGGGELDGYLAEVNFVDGRALDASYFGYTDELTGLWRPKKFDNSGPNNGTTWSSNATASNFSSGAAADVFDGTCQNVTISSTDSSNNHFTLSSVNVKASSVGVRVSNSGSDIIVYINGSSVGTVASGDMSNNVPKLFTFTFTETTVSTIKIQRTGSTSGWYIWEMQLNDVPLVDGDKSNVGINGFRLDFSDNSSATTLGKDRSGNGNDWTPSNISVSSGVGNDSVIDTPTNSFATIQLDMRGPRNNFADTSGTLSEGGLKLVLNGTGDDFGATMFVSEGRWYHEVKLVNSQNHGAGWADLNDFYNDELTGSTEGIVNTDQHYGTGEEGSGSVIVNNGSTSASPSQFADDDVLGFALDLDSAIKNLGIYRNGSLISTITGIAATTFVPIIGDDSSADASYEINFGQQPFVHTQPTGYLTLCTKNIRPNDSLIIKPQKHFDTLIWDGNSTQDRNITGLEFKPDMVWIKSRSHATYGGGLVYHHLIWDVLRGVGSNTIGASSRKELTVNENYQEGRGANYTDYYGHVSSFNKDGFQLDFVSGQPPFYVNQTSRTYVAWCWKAGGAAVTNTVGNISAQVSVNDEAGFSIITYTGDGNTSGNVGTGLRSTQPLGWAIVKRRDDTSDWQVGHSASGQGVNFAYHMNLNDNSALSGSAPYHMGTQSPTNGDRLYLAEGGLTSSATYVAYVWQERPGYSKFGSYSGNGSSDGVYVHLGFRPAWVMIKKTNATDHWNISDAKRGNFNEIDEALYPNNYQAEGWNGSLDKIDYLSNGFKLRANNSQTNGSSHTYIYMAFAEHPGATSFGTFPNAR